MRLIIAEKKSVATAICQTLGTDAARGDGYLRAGNDTIVTWAQGHLIDLATPAEYPDRDWAEWSLDTLPMDPGGHWEWKVSEDKGAALRELLPEADGFFGNGDLSRLPEVLAVR